MISRMLRGGASDVPIPPCLDAQSLGQQITLAANQHHDEHNETNEAGQGATPNQGSRTKQKHIIDQSAQ